MHHILHVISKNPFHFCVCKVNDSFLILLACDSTIAGLMCGFLQFWLTRLIPTYYQNSQVEVVENLFERIALHTHFISLIKDRLTISEDACYHLKRDPTVYDVKEDDGEPKRLLLQVNVKSCHQVYEK